MITFAFTYRNRDIKLVRKCLQSLAQQTNTDFDVLFVNYGSNPSYSADLKEVIGEFPFVKLIDASMVHKQLWNKSRALNIALKQCTSPYFFVADVDMIFKNNFVEKLHSLKAENKVYYFQVGFLSETESQNNKNFDDYTPKFLSTKEATGMTLYPTEVVLKINGYNEFYHGWGAEDTDVHVRLSHGQIPVVFKEDELMILHQWHPKTYRSKNSKEPFHSSLEKINHQFLKHIRNNASIASNQENVWGLMPDPLQYEQLSKPVHHISITNDSAEVDALLCYLNTFRSNQAVHIEIKEKVVKPKVSDQLKSILRKKKSKTYLFDQINDKLLLFVINHLRHHAYEYEWHQKEAHIVLKILL